MCNSSSFSILPCKPVSNNLSQGSYRSKFFELNDYNLSRLEFKYHSYREVDIERILLLGEYSFAYLRDDKLRTIDVYDLSGTKIQFNDFLKHFALKINSNNIYKSGKYLSRVFRPVKYGSFLRNLDVKINMNPETLKKNTDGISLISLKLAKSLGWNEANVNASAQFTLLYSEGLVKGHCIVSNNIGHDVVIFGPDNIKKDICLTNDLFYASLEPVKLSENLNIDIQSILNLWEIFGDHQYLDWAYTGMQQFKADLMSGQLINWLKNSENDDEVNCERWTLRNAINAGIDYRRFPGLLRQAWGMFKKSLLRYANDNNGELNLRIPVPGGLRGYIRIDLRNHDADGNFEPITDKGIITLDNLGNLWIHEADIDEFMKVKGGADQDDSVCIIPLDDDSAIIFRNPNQFGEYGIHKIKYERLNVTAKNKIKGHIPLKEIQTKSEEEKCNKTGNELLDKFLSTICNQEKPQSEYDTVSLLRTYNHIKESNSSIGLAANAEMILSAIRIINSDLALKLNQLYSWNLERIIDSQVKDGVSADADMNAVRNLLEHIYYNRIPVPRNLIYRFPEKMRNELIIESNHPFDLLISAIKYLIKKTDIEILGRGSAKKGNRVPGIIDKLDIPVKEIGLCNLDNSMSEIAHQQLKSYNKSIAIMLEQTKRLDEAVKEKTRNERLEIIQIEFLKHFNQFDNNEKNLLIKSWAYKIYSSERSPHDSILWISDKEELMGTALITIEMLKDILNCELKQKAIPRINLNEGVCTEKIATTTIRLWSKSELIAESFKSVAEIQVNGRNVILGKEKLQVGEECYIQNGIYKVHSVNQSCSRKNNTIKLKNSITIALSY